MNKNTLIGQVFMMIKNQYIKKQHIFDLKKPTVVKCKDHVIYMFELINIYLNIEDFINKLKNNSKYLLRNHVFFG